MSHLVLVGQDQEMAMWMEASSHLAVPSSVPTQSSSLLVCLSVCAQLIQVSAWFEILIAWCFRLFARCSSSPTSL